MPCIFSILLILKGTAQGPPAPDSPSPHWLLFPQFPKGLSDLKDSLGYYVNLELLKKGINLLFLPCHMWLGTPRYIQNPWGFLAYWFSEWQQGQKLNQDSDEAFNTRPNVLVWLQVRKHHRAGGRKRIQQGYYPWKINRKGTSTSASKADLPHQSLQAQLWELRRPTFKSKSLSSLTVWLWTVTKPPSALFPLLVNEMTAAHATQGDRAIISDNASAPAHHCLYPSVLLSGSIHLLAPTAQATSLPTPHPCGGRPSSSKCLFPKANSCLHLRPNFSILSRKLSQIHCAFFPTTVHTQIIILITLYYN